MAIVDLITQHFGVSPSNVKVIGGGDIATAFRFDIHGRQLFCKTISGRKGHLILKAEYSGLKWLKEVKGVRTPEDICVLENSSTTALVMRFLTSHAAPQNQALGEMIARLHMSKGKTHGWHTDNFIGSLSQTNPPTESWVEFWKSSRLIPNIELAAMGHHLTTALLQRIEKLTGELENFLPRHASNRLHGDLWHGNVVYGDGGLPYFIDPAVYFGDREVDLAMMDLFGGFSRSTWDAYYETFPLETNWQERRCIYQLYYALVHVNLFGRSYQSLVETLLSKIGY